MAETTIRRMRIEDLDDVMEMEHLCFSMPWSRESFRIEIEENRCALYLVLAEDGVAVAYAGTWLAIDEGHITNIAVHPAKRGLGYGKRVTLALMRESRKLGIAWMSLEVRRSNEIAQNLYRGLGFTAVGYRKKYYEDNREDALIMVVEDLRAALEGLETYET